MYSINYLLQAYYTSCHGSLEKKNAFVRSTNDIPYYLWSISFKLGISACPQNLPIPSSNFLVQTPTRLKTYLYGHSEPMYGSWLIVYRRSIPNHYAITFNVGIVYSGHPESEVPIVYKSSSIRTFSS